MDFVNDREPKPKKVDRLEDIFTRQESMVKELANNGETLPEEGTPEWREMMNRFVLAIHEEATELLKTTHYKQHRKHRHPFKRTNAVIELVDVVKYAMSVGVLLGVTPDEFYQFEREKHDAVLLRSRQDFSRYVKGEVAMVDIDGVLADYPTSFFNFVREHYGIDRDPATQESYDLARVFGVDKKTYEDMKFRYRESGYKRSIPVVEGAAEGLYFLKSEGYKVVLFTARPKNEFSRIETDTLYWLKQNDMVFDALFFSERKHEDLETIYQELRPAFFVEDNEGNARNLANIGIPVYLFNRPYHSHDTQAEETKGLISRVNHWKNIIDELEAEQENCYNVAQ
jgi:uncharacterized HAD superfamily protein